MIGLLAAPLAGGPLGRWALIGAVAAMAGGYILYLRQANEAAELRAAQARAARDVAAAQAAHNREMAVLIDDAHRRGMAAVSAVQARERASEDRLRSLLTEVGRAKPSPCGNPPALRGVLERVRGEQSGADRGAARRDQDRGPAGGPAGVPARTNHRLPGE